MTTIDDVFLVRWNLLKKGIAYNPTFGIPTFWRQHPELGSPIDKETTLDDGSVAQAFSGGVVRYTSDGGAEIVST